MSQSTLSLQAPAEFFRSLILDSAERQKIVLSPDVEYYIVNLLTAYICVTDNQPNAEPGSSTKVPEIDYFNTPLAIIYKQALESSQDHQIKIFKGLGDTSLYISGFFQESFNRKAIDVDYFAAFGSEAYARISSIMKSLKHDKEFAALYDKLAGKFHCLIDLFADVSEQTSMHMQTDRDIVAVYERWTRWPSDRLRQKLEMSGINPVLLGGKGKTQ